MEKQLFTEQLIKLNLTGTTKNQIIDELADVLVAAGKVTDREKFIKDVHERETQISTELEQGVAMPHSISDAVKEPAVAVGISKTGVVWGESADPSKVFFMVAMPTEATKEHVQVLSRITGVLLEDGAIDTLKNAETKEEIMRLFEEKEKENNSVNNEKVLLLGATGCTSGVAHTYLAAKALEKAAAELGADMKVETNGSVGVDNSPTPEEIARAKCVIIASDRAVEMSRFDGKKIIYAPVKDGINKASELVQRALNGEGEVYRHSGAKDSSSVSQGTGIYKALMNGVSFMLPFVIIGGIMTALAYAIGGQVTDAGLAIPAGSFWEKIAGIGGAGMTLMIPILAGYIAYAIGDKAALAPGMIGGWIANNGSFYNSEAATGFLGAIAAGIIAGYTVKALKKIKVPELVQSVMPIIVIPIVATLVVAAAFIFVIGAPISSLMTAMSNMLANMSTGNLIILGIIMGFMQGFDFGGPVGKTLFMFNIGMMAQGQFNFIGAEAMAIPVAPLGMALATFLDRKNKYFDEEDKASGKAALIMGFCGISEGAIPFAAKEPLAVIPASMISAAVASVLGLLFGITDQIAWGGPLVVVLGLTNKPVLALIAMLAGSAVMALLYFVFHDFAAKKKA